MNRPFAFNPGSSAIAGCETVGNVSAGNPTSGFSSTGLTWWGGPEETNNYFVVFGGTSTQRAGRNGATANLFCRKSSSFTDNSFIEMANNIGATTFASVSAAKTWLNTNGYWTNHLGEVVAGLFKTTYNGYFADNVSFFATATPQAFGVNPITSVQTTAILEPGSDDGSNFSCQWLGYFKPSVTSTYVFYLSSDDASYMWIGATAISGFSAGNAVVQNGGLHGNQETSGVINLTADVYYPVRIQFGENGGGDIMTLSYSHLSQAKTTNVTGLVFYNSATNGF